MSIGGSSVIAMFSVDSEPLLSDLSLHNAPLNVNLPPLDRFSEYRTRSHWRRRFFRLLMAIRPFARASN